MCRCPTSRIFVLNQTTTVENINPILGTFEYGYRTGTCSRTNFNYFKVSDSIFYYFPKDLENAFPTPLKGIHIDRSKLKEIHQSDLMSYDNLEFLDISGNEIQSIEKDLFKFNPNLAYISLSHNHIKHVNPIVFDDLSKLKTLYSALNPCIPHKESNGNNIEASINEIREKCSPRADGSSNWRDDEELDIGIDNDKVVGSICECAELLTATIVLSIALIVIITADTICIMRNRSFSGIRNVFRFRK